ANASPTGSTRKISNAAARRCFLTSLCTLCTFLSKLCVGLVLLRFSVRRRLGPAQKRKIPRPRHQKTKKRQGESDEESRPGPRPRERNCQCLNPPRPRRRNASATTAHRRVCPRHVLRHRGAPSGVRR